MPESITLLGERKIFIGPRGRSIPLEVIVGLEAPDGTSLGKMRTGDSRYPTPHRVEPRRTTFALGSAAANSLVTMYGIFERGASQKYNCHGLVMYLCGAANKLAEVPPDRVRYGNAPLPIGLEPGQAYCVVNRLMQVAHSMLALDEMTSLSCSGMSILGGGLLVRGAHPHMMSAYSGVVMREMVDAHDVPLRIDVEGPIP